MLVLSRKKNESIVINGNVKIVVVRIDNSSVRLGIEAPAEIPILRAELIPPPAPSISQRMHPEVPCMI